MKIPIKCIFLFASLVVEGAAQDLRFFAQPYEAFEGDAVLFHYRNDVAVVKLGDIASWKWDLDGDGNWDEEKVVDGVNVEASDINTSWISTFDEGEAVNGVQVVRPVLQVTTTLGAVVTQTGVTEDVFGLNEAVDPDLFIKERSIGTNQIRVNFSANPRLAEPLEEVKFYSDVDFVDGVEGRITAYHWDLNGDGNVDSNEPNPTFNFPDSGVPTHYDVSLHVDFSVTQENGAEAPATSPTETKRRYVQIQSVPESLQLGRAYRRGFPQIYGWEDIIEAYQARGVNNNRHVYFNHFEDAFFDKQNDLLADEANAEKRRELAECVNELLQGQTLVANQQLVEALRIKYPKLASFDPNNPPEELPQPAGAREETAAIDRALLDYQLGYQYVGVAMRRYGPDILRKRALEGAEPFPQFPRYISFQDPSLSQAPIPIKNEYWQASTAFERAGLGRMEKAKKLYRLSAQDDTALDEAKEEAKVAATQSYLALAVLAVGQDASEFQQNECNRLLVHVKNARDLFERINEGLNPLGNDGSFIPNESFAAIQQDAEQAVADAREAELHARQEERTYERYQAELRGEHLSQRNSYITPLKNLTSIDPADYNNLQTVDDQRDYRNVVNSRLEAVLEDYPDADPGILGEIGEQVINVLDAGLAVEQAINSVSNVYKRIDIVKWQNARIQEIDKKASERLLVVDVVSAAITAKIAPTELTARTAAVKVVDFLASAARSRIRALQTMAIQNTRADAEIRGILLELENLSISVERANNNLRQAQLRLDNMLARMDRLIEDLSHTRATAADLYFQDPSFRVVVSDALRRAEGELDFAIDRLYRLAKTLEYEWTEPYQNPVIIPVNSFEPPSLENPLFDKFTEIDSLFFVRGADEAKDYLDALKAWDSKLRRINVTSVRGPNFSGPLSAEPISYREDILNLVPDDTRGFDLGDSIAAFRNYLETQRMDNFFEDPNPSLQLTFQTTIEDNRFFPATGSRWNMRLHGISADVFAETGFSNKQVVEIDLVQTGTVSLRRFFAEPPAADDVMKLTFNAPNLLRTAFAVSLPAKVNGATGLRPPDEFLNLGLRNRPVAATNWILTIDTQNPTNREVDFSKIKDLVLRFTYTYGNPPEFPNF